MKTIFEQMGGTYHEENGYLIPNLVLPAKKEERPIGIWGQRHLRYIRQNKRRFYMNMLISDKLSDYLADVDKRAADMFSRLVDQMAEREGIPEQLKAENQMLWVQRMNGVRNSAAEIINADLIYN